MQSAPDNVCGVVYSGGLWHGQPCREPADHATRPHVDTYTGMPWGIGAHTTYRDQHDAHAHHTDRYGRTWR